MQCRHVAKKRVLVSTQNRHSNSSYLGHLLGAKERRYLSDERIM